MSEVIISPSILSSDFANLGRDIRFMEKSGADWIHIDVMDGHFVPNITIGAPVVKSIRKVTQMPFDVHLMIENPKKYIKDFVEAGADIVTFHYEAVPRSEIIETAEYIKGFGIKAGLSIKPKTNPEEILEYLPYFDLLLVMTVEPGFGGQKFLRECAEKIDLIKRFADESMIIQVDGGINANNIDNAINAGANIIVAGTAVFNDDIEGSVRSLMR